MLKSPVMQLAPAGRPHTLSLSLLLFILLFFIVVYPAAGKQRDRRLGSQGSTYAADGQRRDARAQRRHLHLPFLPVLTFCASGPDLSKLSRKIR